MVKCPNCGRELSCSCAIRVSKTGKRCCSYCVAEENKKADSSRLNKYKLGGKIVNMNRRNVII